MTDNGQPDATTTAVPGDSLQARDKLPRDVAHAKLAGRV